MKVLVIVPAYNEADRIAGTVREIIRVGFPVLAVDDGSEDETASRARAAGARTVSHPVNRGQGAALQTGIEYFLAGNYQIGVFFDADGQMAAEEIFQLIKPLESGKAEVALGSRFLGKAEGISRPRLVVLKLALVFSRLTTGLKITDVHNGFQAWSRRALEKIELTQDRQAYASEILEEIAAKKFNYQEVPVTIRYFLDSRKKSQSIFNAFSIIWDLFFRR